MDEDVSEMSREELVAEVRKLRAGSALTSVVAAICARAPTRPRPPRARHCTRRR
jgi:hypothetical protein